MRLDPLRLKNFVVTQDLEVPWVVLKEDLEEEQVDQSQLQTKRDHTLTRGKPHNHAGVVTTTPAEGNKVHTYQVYRALTQKCTSTKDQICHVELSHITVRTCQ